MGNIVKSRLRVLKAFRQSALVGLKRPRLNVNGILQVLKAFRQSALVGLG